MSAISIGVALKVPCAGSIRGARKYTDNKGGNQYPVSHDTDPFCARQIITLTRLMADDHGQSVWKGSKISPLGARPRRREVECSGGQAGSLHR